MLGTYMTTTPHLYCVAGLDHSVRSGRGQSYHLSSRSLRRLNINNHLIVYFCRTTMLRYWTHRGPSSYTCGGCADSDGGSSRRWRCRSYCLLGFGLCLSQNLLRNHDQLSSLSSHQNHSWRTASTGWSEFKGTVYNIYILRRASLLA